MRCGSTVSAVALQRLPPLPDGIDRRRLHRPGSPPLLRLLRGDADSDLRPDRRLGQGRAHARNRVTFVIYTMAGSLLMLASIVVFGLSHRGRSRSSTPARRPASGSSWASSLPSPSRRRSSVPRLARRCLPRVAARGRRDSLGVVSKAAVYGLLRIVIAKFPEPCTTSRRRFSPSQRSGSSTARCLRSVRLTSARSPRIPRWRRWA